MLKLVGCSDVLNMQFGTAYSEVDETSELVNNRVIVKWRRRTTPRPVQNTDQGPGLPTYTLDPPSQCSLARIAMTNSCHWSAKAVRISCWAADSARSAKRMVLACANTVSSRSRRRGLKISARRHAPKEDRDVASAVSSYTATQSASAATGSNTRSGVPAWTCAQ